MGITKKKIPVAIGLLMIIIGASYILLDTLGVFDKSGEIEVPPVDYSVVVVDNVDYIPNDGINYLLMGVDKYGGFVDEDDISTYNTQSADFIAVLSLNQAEKSYTVFHINRDSMVKFDLLGVGGYKYGTTNGQICLSHMEGNGGSISAKNTVNAVKNYFSAVTGFGTIKIDHYIAFTMDLIPIVAQDVMDIVSGEKNHGVTITLNEGQSLEGMDLSNSTLDGNKLTLRGEDALSFIRSRHYVDDSTNIARMNRQQQFMEGFVAELSSSDMTEKQMLDCFSVLTGNDYFMSDASEQQLGEFLEAISQKSEDGSREYDYCGIVAPKGDAIKGEEFIEFYPDASDLKRLMIEVFLQRKVG